MFSFHFFFKKDISGPFDSFSAMNHIANPLIDYSEGSFFVKEKNSLIGFFPVFDRSDPFPTINHVVSSLINYIVAGENALIVFCL